MDGVTDGCIGSDVAEHPLSSGTKDPAHDFTEEIRSSQGRLGAGQTFHGRTTTGGVVAASSPLDTGFGFDYSQDLHVGATSWYLFAAMRFNPFRF